MVENKTLDKKDLKPHNLDHQYFHPILNGVESFSLFPQMNLTAI